MSTTKTTAPNAPGYYLRPGEIHAMGVKELRLLGKKMGLNYWSGLKRTELREKLARLTIPRHYLEP